ncbi:hypothetical protein D3C87_1344220 [compost metagenome]
MKARDDSANAVTEMIKMVISGERIRRSRRIVTVNVERTRAPPSIERRTARLPAIGEFATYATATSTSRNSPIQANQGRAVIRWSAASGGRWYESIATNSRTDMTSRETGP